MADITIKVSWDSEAGKIAITSEPESSRGRGNETLVHPGNTVKWKLARNSGLKSINSISKKNIDGNADLIESISQNENGDWVAHLKTRAQGATNDAIERYSIGYTKEDGNTHTHDPKMKMVLGSGGGGS